MRFCEYTRRNPPVNVAYAQWIRLKRLESDRPGQLGFDDKFPTSHLKLLYDGVDKT